MSEFFLKKSHSLRMSLTTIFFNWKTIHDACTIHKSKCHVRKLTYLKAWLYQKGIFVSVAYTCDRIAKNGNGALRQ